jgi:hypothetical protein
MPSSVTTTAPSIPPARVPPRKPTAEDCRAPIDRYSLTQLQAVPIGHDLRGGGGGRWRIPVTVKFAVGEVWAKAVGEWKCRYYQATILK